MDNESDSEDDDSIDIDTAKESKNPYFKRVGKLFLLLAVIVGILVVILPTTLDLKLNTNAVIFRILFGIFMFCLFLCILMIYVVGSSGEAWEDPSVMDIHFNFTNIIIIVGIIIEFIQVCSFSFNLGSQFTGSEQLRWFNYAAVPAPNKSFRVLYWILFVFAFSPYIFVVSVRLILYFMTRKMGENYTANFIAKYQQKIYSVLWFLVNTMYLPVISTMFGGEDCSVRTNNNVTTATLDSDPNISCFKGLHISFMICSLIALVIYYPAASFAQSQTQNISEIKFKPRVVFIFAQGKVVLAAMTVFATTLITTYLGAVLAVNIIFLIINIVLKPCLVDWVNRMRTVLYSLCLVATICSWIAYGGAPSVLPLILLIVGWVGLSILFYLFYKLKPTLSDTLISLGIRKRKNLSVSRSNSTINSTELNKV
ncbi:hypothetical protein DICPUDRAFT_43818 [Dictyostelium purpureum]|uniref:Uncharacterized protein n=1 Tax=Dictyostelium purpureum TaxID=5786 RepID=F1A4V4_DICPU|nr:uncharacterized protein DICPUDRAFT_43818 [Dictyostelium purpureum]EGC28774.1 hypothetical protein DICPUDRAFT_43818 [Dictyostelium purpureum]|eukprot:XP_003294698.1 hypothetical protein DICPUDRAFT_43818 [Dictyostelium purpureum]